jgi:hypothetical protein
MEIGQVDHLTIIQKISSKFRSKRLFTPKLGGHVLTPFFEKKQVKKDKEKQPMESRVQLAD